MKKRFFSIWAAAGLCISMAGCAVRLPVPSQPTNPTNKSGITTQEMDTFLRTSIKITTDDALLTKSLMAIPGASAENTPTEEELSQRNIWIAELRNGKRSLISLKLGDQMEDLTMWERTAEESNDTLTLSYTKNSLTVKVLVRLAADTAALEWQTFLINTGSENTPLLSKISLLDIALPAASAKLTWSNGSNAKADDFAMTTEILEKGVLRKPTNDGGRSSSGVMPYWSLDCGSMTYLGAIGWTGQWLVNFCQEDGVVNITSGMTNGKYYLLPGEQLNLPSMALIPSSDGNGFNKLRRWMQLYHTPQYNGQLTLGPISHGAWGAASVNQHLNNIEAIKNASIGYGAYWIDAAWYGDEEDSVSHSAYDDVWFQNAGTWEHLKSFYPDGLAPIGQAAADAGLRFLLWFEPERANVNSKLAKEHPEWFLTSKSNKENLLFNFADDEARTYMTDFICGKIREYGVKIYRQDFNISPLEYWVLADKDNRRGITEIKYINGMYQFWRDLLERNPGLTIDNCAGGGRRLDFAALSLTTVMSKSDYQCFEDVATSEGCQTLMHGLNHWIEPAGIFAMRRLKPYEVRCNYGYSLQMQIDMGPVKMQKAVIQEMRRCQPLFCGDYFPLLWSNVSEPDWTAFQFNRADTGKGMVLAFCNGSDLEATVMLKGLDTTATYQVECVDTGESVTVTGAKLSEGLRLKTEATQQSLLYFYSKIS